MTLNLALAENSDQLAKDAAQFFVETAKESIAVRGRFAAAFAGGSTPKATYHLLGESGFADQIDWRCIHIFWGDERCVPPAHADSNYRMAADALLNHIPLPPENIHRMLGERAPQEAAGLYENELRSYFGESPRFDLILLGMGTDGHTASLFPGTAAIHEAEKWVVAHHVEKLQAWRITLTPAIINRARQIAFLVSGENKAEPLQRVLQGDFQPDILPSQIINPKNGTITWFIDKPASKYLD